LNPFSETRQSEPAMARECCKVCTKGKPCGDTCIEKGDECHVSPGCACLAPIPPAGGDTSGLTVSDR
jgi:hypothetical protein